VKIPLRGGAGFLTVQIQIDFTPFWRALRDHPEKFILALGLLLRLWVYAQNRTYWMDEGTLSTNIVGVRPLDFSDHLKGDQLAPIGFLIVERAATWAFGSSRYVARLLPLVCGLAAPLIFWRLAARILSRSAALVALTLMAFSDDAVYYSSELKPYSLDLAAALALMTAVVDALGKPVSERRAVLMAVAVAAAPWFTFASAFVIAGCGAALLFACIQSGRRRDVAVWLAVGVVWLASFVAAYRASQNILNPATTMYVFWAFAFLPLGHWPPIGRDLARSAGILLEIFVNPLNLVGPIWPRIGVVFPIALVVAGTVSLARRSRSVCLMLLAPLALAMIASALKRYPLHGRLILELVPAFYVLVAEGTDVLRVLDGTHRQLAYKLLLAFLLAYPVFSACYEATGARPRYFNSHGDLHDNIFME
jgi:Dolichyl-phosphate-mannose-protein mannosyltransferase